MNKVRIYTTSTCVFCLPMKQFLKQQGVEYQEIDISQGEAIEELRQKTGQIGVPVVEVGDQIVIGFDRVKLTKILKSEGLI